MGQGSLLCLPHSPQSSIICACWLRFKSEVSFTANSFASSVASDSLTAVYSRTAADLFRFASLSLDFYSVVLVLKKE